MTKINYAEEIRKLVELQEIDKEIYGKKNVLDRVPERLKALDDELNNKSATLKKHSDELVKLQLDRKTKEGELSSKEQSMKKYQGQLFQVKTNQEYASLEKEIASIKADSSILEDGIISVLEGIDKAQKIVEQEKKILDAEGSKSGEEKKKIESEKTAAQAEHEELVKKREEFAKDLDKTILSKYERVLAGKGGVAVVPVVGDACGGCNMNLPPQVINEVKLMVDLRFCENCARILFLKG